VKNGFEKDRFKNMSHAWRFNFFDGMTICKRQKVNQTPNA